MSRVVLARLLVLLLVPGWGAAEVECTAASDAAPVLTSRTLDVVTLNLAHGRHDALNQALVPAATLRANLDAAAALLRDTGADVIALQEADAPSRWSGGFDHVAHLAAALGTPCRVHGHHSRTPFATFGTALLSTARFGFARIHAFAPTPPTTQKGFVVATVAWNPDARLVAPLDVTLVSVHLDFLNARARTAQVAALAQALEAVHGPLVVMGDFNSTWEARDSVVRRLATALDLHAHAPTDGGYATYPESGRRLDWILASGELAFADYAVRDEAVSDHLAVVARLALARAP